MVEVESTGTLKSGEKALAELRKRKLIVQKCGDKCSFCTCTHRILTLSGVQEGSIFHCREGTQLQHINSKTGDRPYG